MPLPEGVRTYDLESHWIKHEVDVVTLSTNSVDSRDEANTLIESGRADLCQVLSDVNLQHS